MKPATAKLGTVLAAALLAAHANGQTFHDIVIDDQTFTQFIPAPFPGEVSVSMAVGELIVRGWSQDQIRVSGELGSAAVRVELTQDEGTTLINVVPNPVGSESAHRHNIDLMVNMPRQSSLTFSTTDAEALITGVYGSQSLHTISGDIETEIWSGSVTAESASGDLTISNFTGFGPFELGYDEEHTEDSIKRTESSMVVLTTLSGDIEARGPFNHLSASTFSGDIDLDVADASMLYLDTSNGDIQVQATLSAGAEVNAETINGDVELDVGEEGNLTLDLGSYGGRIENCFGYEEQQSGSGSGHELTVEGPADSPRLRVRTLTGDIELCSS